MFLTTSKGQPPGKEKREKNQNKAKPKPRELTNRELSWGIS